MKARAPTVSWSASIGRSSSSAVSMSTGTGVGAKTEGEEEEEEEPEPSRAFHRSHCFFARGVTSDSGGTNSDSRRREEDCAKACAPAETSVSGGIRPRGSGTWACSRMRRARRMGCMIPSRGVVKLSRIIIWLRDRFGVPETAPTLPKSAVRPSMREASHSTVPERVRLEP